MVRVSKLTIYPLKSGAGIDVAEAKIGTFGFEFDRFWIVAKKVDSKWEMVTQREYSQMVLIKPKILTENGKVALILNAPEMSEIEIPMTLTGELVSLQVWKDTVEGYVQGNNASEWISKYLGFPCHILAKNESQVRSLAPKHTPAQELFQQTPQTAFADGFPFLLLSEASVTEFVKDHPNPNTVSTRTFRPNITITDCEPYGEDKFMTLTINGTTFYGTSLCTRCVMTNNDPDTGIPQQDTLKVIQKTRRVDPGAKYQGCMGINLTHQSTGGIVRVGDEVNILSTGQHHHQGVWNGKKVPAVPIR